MGILRELLAPYFEGATSIEELRRDPVYGGLFDLAEEAVRLGTPGAGGSPDLGERSTEGLRFGVPDPRYVAMAEAVLKAIERRFPEAYSLGIFDPRNIRGTSTPSEHAYGAAVDVGVGSNRLGDAIYRWLMRPRVQERFGYTNVLWEVPDHWDHLHIGFLY